MKFTLGFSPCPNDTFIFDALVNKKIDSEGLEFEVMLEDVETLNRWAIKGRLDVTKLSFPAFFQSLDKYVLLRSGSALGKGVGPLLISKSKVAGQKSKVEDSDIALPGENTTANFLFSFAFPGAGKKKFMLFSKIEESVLNDDVDLGVIIHENRFTYQQKGLHKVIDLGEYWEEKMQLPIPLGGVAVRKAIDNSTARKIERLVKKSLDHAFANYPQLADFVKLNSQEMSEDVMRQHIDLYVNNYSLDLGNEGKKAIESLYKVFAAVNQDKTSTSSSGLFLS
jgi:1,4-dihydroxy-6-naphthoate synthase